MRVFLLVVMCIIPISAVGGPMRPGNFFESEVRLRPVPTGLGFGAAYGRQSPFYESSNIALSRNGIAYGAMLQFSPISAHPGVFVRVIPLTVLELEFGVQGLSYFGVLNSVLAYPSTDADWSQGGQKGRRERKGVVPGLGYSAFGIGRLKLKVSGVVLVSEYELRHVRLISPTTEVWYDAERNQLMKASDVYQRSLSILGWMFGSSMDDSHILAALSWSEWNSIANSNRHLAGLGLIRQISNNNESTRWLFVLATYLQDAYQQNEIFGAFVWKKSLSL
ncbi:MAG: hypothetical protein ACPGQS_12945 [Bradymonadia bacterium]